MKEAVEVRLTKNNFNIDVGFILNQAWSPITMLMNVVGPHRADTRLHLPTLCSSLSAMCRGCGQEYHDEGGLRSESVSLWLGQRLSSKC